jgi:prepilin-type N-terminal cleavage/methylation domain-containing protein/prepilin-type processing-associated H-X9-DG protein
MCAIRLSKRPKGFTLIELLCVIAIIGVLASLLLPVVNQGRARAKRIGCTSNLRQMGVSFQSFAHDHNGQFPMAVPLNAGGSQEFTTMSYQVIGMFFFSFHHFQSLSNDLVSPKLLVCPADTRRPAASFASLNNGNLSYFVGLRAEYSRPHSVLAGDRNLTNAYAQIPTLLRPQLNRGWRWTAELHQFKGNLLFADGHVEEKTSQTLAGTLEQMPFAGELALPDLPRLAQAGHFNPSFPEPKFSSSQNPKMADDLSRVPNHLFTTAQHLTPRAAPVAETISLQSTGSDLQTNTNTKTQTSPTQVKTGPMEKPGTDQEPGFSFFPPGFWSKLFNLLNKAAWILYLLALLLAATAFLLRLRSHRHWQASPNLDLDREGTDWSFERDPDGSDPRNKTT